MSAPFKSTTAKGLGRAATVRVAVAFCCAWNSAEFLESNVCYLVAINGKEGWIFHVSFDCESKTLCCATFDAVLAIHDLKARALAALQMLDDALALICNSDHDAPYAILLEPREDPVDQRSAPDLNHGLGSVVC